MSDENLVSRREFTLEAALAMLAGVTITITSCGGDDDPGSSPSPQPGGGRVGTISANHGHVAEITSAQLTAGAAISLDIRGQADHPHTVQLSQAELMLISAGTRVQKESSNNSSHTHFVTFN